MAAEQLHADALWLSAPQARLRCGPLADTDLSAVFALGEPETFCLRMTGQAMRGAGILPGDVIVCRRSLLPEAADIVVVQSPAGFLIRYWLEKPELVLRAAHEDYPDISYEALGGYELFGVVWGVIRKLPPPAVQARGHTVRG